MSIIQGKCINYALQIFKDFWEKKWPVYVFALWTPDLGKLRTHLQACHSPTSCSISFHHTYLILVVQQCDFVFVFLFLEFLLRPTYKIWSLHSLNLCEGVNLVMIVQFFRDISAQQVGFRLLRWISLLWYILWDLPYSFNIRVRP